MFRTLSPRRALHAAALLLLIVFFLALLPAAPQAAASGFGVETGGDGAGGSWYWVSTPSYHADKPSFSSSERDSFLNVSSGGDVRIRFFNSFELATQEQAETLARYLSSQASYPCYAGWFSFYDPVFQAASYCVFLFEGADPSDPRMDADELINRNSWQNCEGLSMELYLIGSGDLRSSQSTFIYDALECSAAVFVPVSGRSGRTFGFAFYDLSRDPPLVKRYCSDELR